MSAASVYCGEHKAAVTILKSEMSYVYYVCVA